MTLSLPHPPNNISTTLKGLSVCLCERERERNDGGWLFSSFKQLVEATPPSDLLSAEEKEELWRAAASADQEVRRH